MPVDPSKPWDLSDAEAPAATAALSVDDISETYATAIAQATRTINASSRKAVAAWHRLAEDDTSNPIGVERMFAELPAALRSETDDALLGLDQSLQALENHHVTQLLQHDSRGDANLRWLVDHHLAGVQPGEAAAKLVELAHDPNFASFLAGPAGRALADHYGLKNVSFREAALAALSTDGNERQRKHGKALARLGAVKHAVGLARGGRNLALERIALRPERRPSGAR